MSGTPSEADALARGHALLAQGRSEEGLACLARAAAEPGATALAHFQHAAALHRLAPQRLDEAIDGYRRAVALQPGLARAWGNLAVALKARGRLDESLACHARALALDPLHAEGWSNQGTALEQAGRLPEALQSLDRALALNPRLARTHGNRAGVLTRLGHLAEALAGYDQALALEPRWADAHHNRSVALERLDRVPEALAACEQALAIDPRHPDAGWNRSLHLLKLGRFAEGWPGYEARLHRSPDTRARALHPDLPRWAGDAAEAPCPAPAPSSSDCGPAADPLSGRRLLLRGEQGLGDQIMMARYAPLLADRGAQVLLQVSAPLVRLMRSLRGVSEVLAHEDDAPPCDLQCPLMSLPLAFGTRLETIPAPGADLACPTELLQAWQQRLGPRPPGRMRIGIAFSGGDNPSLQERSIPLEQLQPLLLAPGVEWISLHKAVRERDQPLLQRLVDEGRLRHFGEQQADLLDAAALCLLVDRVISIDTSLAHLAAALGRPTWILLPFAAEWRWLRERADSPWYPSARLFRQPAPGNWDAVLRQVAQAGLHP